MAITTFVIFAIAFLQFLTIFTSVIESYYKLPNVIKNLIFMLGIAEIIGGEKRGYS